MNRDELLTRIGQKPTRDGKVLCPVHADRHPSLTIKDGENGLLLKCWSCNASVQEICAAWGITVSDLFYEERREKNEPVAVYDYGTYEVVRSIDASGRKTFRQRHTVNGETVWNMRGVRRELYRRDIVAQAAAQQATIILVEGEKDVHTLEKYGFLATTASGGSKAPWEPWFTEQLSGARVVVIPDNDPPGRAYAQKVVGELDGKTPVALLELDGLPEAGDVSDWLPKNSPEELEKRINAAFQPKTKARSRADVFASTMAEINRYQEGQVVGMPWPVEWPTLSQTIGPLVPGALTVVGAKTSHGKSIVAQQLARRICRENKTVLTVTLELTPERLLSREFAYLGADLKRLRRKGGMTSQDWQAINTFEREMEGLGEQWYLSASTVAEIDYEIGILKPSIVIVDYLHRLHQNGKDEYHSITNNMNEIQDVTLRHNVPVVILSQLRRPGERDEFRRPHMSDLRGSGAIEERAANIILLQRRFEKLEEDPTQRVKTDRGAFFIEKNADGEADRKIGVRFMDGRFEIREEL